MFLKPQKIIFNSLIKEYKLQDIKPNQSNNNQELIDQLEIDIKLNGLLCPLVVSAPELSAKPNIQYIHIYILYIGYGIAYCIAYWIAYWIALAIVVLPIVLAIVLDIVLPFELSIELSVYKLSVYKVSVY